MTARSQPLWEHRTMHTLLEVVGYETWAGQRYIILQAPAWLWMGQEKDLEKDFVKVEGGKDGKTRI